MERKASHIVSDIKVGEELAKARTQCNVSQKEMAEYLNVSVNHISAIENGRNQPGFPIFWGYCKKLEMSPNAILHYTENNYERMLKDDARFMERTFKNLEGDIKILNTFLNRRDIALSQARRMAEMKEREEERSSDSEDAFLILSPLRELLYRLSTAQQMEILDWCKKKYGMQPPTERRRAKPRQPKPSETVEHITLIEHTQKE